MLFGKIDRYRIQRYCFKWNDRMALLVGGTVALANLGNLGYIVYQNQKENSLNGIDILPYIPASLAKGICYGVIWPAYLGWVCLKSCSIKYPVVLKYGKYQTSVDKNSWKYQIYPLALIHERH